MAISRRARLGGGLTVAAMALARAGSAAGKPTITVYKSPTCGCCAKWVTHLRDHGFPVKAEDLEDLRPIKQRHGVPAALESCHTGVVEGYVVEGHVPADLVERMLRERPQIAGLAVPGMPIGSPGMEVPGRAAESYQILAFDKSGRSTVYARR